MTEQPCPLRDLADTACKNIHLCSNVTIYIVLFLAAATANQPLIKLLRNSKWGLSIAMSAGWADAVACP